MEPESLRLFLRTLETGSLSAAGRELGLSPAVASKRLAALEKRLGVTLLHRTTRLVTPTADGQIFEDHARQIVESMQAAEAALGLGLAAPAGRLRVTAPANLARRHVTPVLAEFLGRYPKIELDVVLADTLLDLQQEAIDVAIRVSALQDSALIARKLAPSERILCASPAYIERHGMPRRPDELRCHNCLCLGASTVWELRRGQDVCKIPVAGNLRTNSGDLIRDAVLADLGIAMKSVWDIEDLLASGAILPVLEDWEVLTHAAIWAVWQPQRFLPAKTRAFVDFLAARFKAAGP